MRLFLANALHDIGQIGLAVLRYPRQRLARRHGLLLIHVLILAGIFSRKVSEQLTSLSYGLILLRHGLTRQEVLLRKRAVNWPVLVGFGASVIYYLAAAAEVVNIGR